MRRKKLIWHLFPFFLLVTLVTLAAVTWYSARSWRTFFLEQTARDLETRARLVESRIGGSAGLENGPGVDKLCKDLGKITATRLTVILTSGQVLGDTEEDPARMDNHGDRPEFREAMTGRVGVSTRFSFTLGHNQMYVAVPVKDQDKITGAVRASLPVTSIDQALRVYYFQIIFGGLIIALLVAFLSFIISRRLSGPLENLKRGALRFAQGDLHRKLPIPQTDELASLAEVMNDMAAKLEDRINALVRQGQMQEAVLSSMIEGVLAIDAEQRLVALNRAAARLLGVDPESGLDQPIQEVVRDPALRWFINRTLAAREALEQEVAVNNGKLVLQAHGTSLRDAAGTKIGSLIVLHDVTHLRRLEMMRRDFVANVSHELKTPITSIKGFVETLLAGALHEPENAENFLRIIARQSDRLNEIINDLLSLSRIEQDSERGQIFLTAQRIKGVLAAAVEVCEAKARERGINIRLDCPDDLRARVNAPLLEQAVVNLVDNAVKYSEKDREIRVEAERAGPEVVVRVRDQGSGIAPVHLPRLFERFYRVDSGRSRSSGGTGLGLAIVKHIAQAHGGKVTVESAPGKGSIFSLHLLPD
ncbi:MAG: HAMP domain-containing histidine kinase [Deltaproteobacteria bacterium]|nr:MAG: HAMP domain-containing histidine kinase [Deltaproteobacteria bacterium]